MEDVKRRAIKTLTQLIQVDLAMTTTTTYDQKDISPTVSKEDIEAIAMWVKADVKADGSKYVFTRAAGFVPIWLRPTQRLAWLNDHDVLKLDS